VRNALGSFSNFECDGGTQSCPNLQDWVEPGLQRSLQWATLVSKDGKKGSNLCSVRHANTR